MNRSMLSWRVAPLAAAVSCLLIAATGRRGYLASDVDISAVVPPPPQKGDARYESDRRVFRATRALLSTPRGELATRDVPYTAPDLMRDFSCTAGVKLSPEATPAIYRLLTNADTDTQEANEAAKQRWRHPRPFLIDRGPICQSRQELTKSYDYPSGHATHGWTFGLILADLEPDRATAILARARAYGESRIVCGAHTMSAVEAAQLGATVSLQQVRADTHYQRDFAAARAELENSRHDPQMAPDAPSCSAEQALTSQSIFADLKR